jgi:hypothetical protein
MEAEAYLGHDVQEGEVDVVPSSQCTARARLGSIDGDRKGKVRFERNLGLREGLRLGHHEPDRNEESGDERHCERTHGCLLVQLGSTGSACSWKETTSAVTLSLAAFFNA